MSSTRMPAKGRVAAPAAVARDLLFKPLQLIGRYARQKLRVSDAREIMFDMFPALQATARLPGAGAFKRWFRRRPARGRQPGQVTPTTIAG